MKFIKIFYFIDNEIDCNCLNDCPFGEVQNKTVIKCGSVTCSNCKHCFGSKFIAMWDLSKNRGLNFNQGYICCDKVYTEINFKIKFKKIIYRICKKIKKIFK